MINEIVKIVKKKSFIIMLCIITGWAFLTNFIYRSFDDLGEMIEETSFTESEDEDAEDDIYLKIENAVTKEKKQLEKKYDEEAWQSYYIDNYLDEYLRTIISHDLGYDEDEDAYESNKVIYEEILKGLEDDDWRHVVKTEIKHYETQVKSDPSFKIDLEGAKIRLDKDIIYGDDYQNANLERLIDSQTSLWNISLYYKADLDDDYKLDKETIDKMDEVNETDYHNHREQYLTNKYALEHNLDFDKMGSNYTVFTQFFSEYSLMIVIMIFIIAGSMMSNEYSTGTIKLLLVRPYTRMKILLSKYLTLILSILFTIGITMLIQLIVGSIILDIKSLSMPVTVYSPITDTLNTYSLVSYLGLSTMGILPAILILATLSFMFGTIFNSKSLAITVGFVAYFIGNIFSVFIESGKAWLKYIVSFNWDWTPYIFNLNPTLKGLTFNFSVLICLLWLGAMLVTAFVVFKHKDINNI